MNNQRVGFIGLGNMGYGMAFNLLKNDYEVVGYDIDARRVELITNKGAIGAGSVKEVVDHADVLILCLPKPEISHQVLFSKDGIVAHFSDKIVIETSTLTPELVLEFEQKLSKKNIGFLSAPMFGGQSSAEAGRIWFVVEGKKELANRYQNLFMAMGRKVSYVGKIPQATIAKLTRNMCRFANVATALEVLELLHHTTDDIEPIYKLLVEDSKTNFDHVWEQAMKDVALNKEPYKASHISVKDLKLSLELAKKHKVAMPVIAAVKKNHQEHQS